MATSQASDDRGTDKVPEEIESWADGHCRDVKEIKRYSEEHEAGGRGWSIYTDEIIRPHDSPDWFHVSRIRDDPVPGRDGIKVQVRET